MSHSKHLSSAIHAYDVSIVLTYVSAGTLLDPPHQSSQELA